MNELSKRQSLILEKIIREYIRLAQPISSDFLEKKYQFGLCSATIRNEMQSLTEKGFLFQSHPSSGRIPTDKGYRFFVNFILELGIKDWREKIKDLLETNFENETKFIQQLTKRLAEATETLTLSYQIKEKIVWKEGWEEILKEPEFEEKKCVLKFLDFIEDVEKKIEDLEIDSDIKIFIGRENPFRQASDFSLITSKCCLPDGDNMILSLLGPKRMSYEKNISLIRSLTKILEDY